MQERPAPLEQPDDQRPRVIMQAQDSGGDVVGCDVSEQFPDPLVHLRARVGAPELAVRGGRREQTEPVSERAEALGWVIAECPVQIRRDREQTSDVVVVPFAPRRGEGVGDIPHHDRPAVVMWHGADHRDVDRRRDEGEHAVAPQCRLTAGIARRSHEPVPCERDVLHHEPALGGVDALEEVARESADRRQRGPVHNTFDRDLHRGRGHQPGPVAKHDVPRDGPVLDMHVVPLPGRRAAPRGMTLGNHRGAARKALLLEVDDVRRRVPPLDQLGEHLIGTGAPHATAGQEGVEHAVRRVRAVQRCHVTRPQPHAEPLRDSPASRTLCTSVSIMCSRSPGSVMAR